MNKIACPECGTEVVIYKGWANFGEDTIEILKGAKWRCPNCGNTGKLGDN